MSFQIIGGRFKGHSLQSPPESTTRPTKSIVRGSIFNICQSWIDGASVLDLFAGSGAIGLEALSRAAASALFVEKNHNVVRTLRANIEKLGVIAQVWELDVRSACQRLQKEGRKFDLIYIDPPYDKGLDREALLVAEGLLSEHGLLFVEESSRGKEEWAQLPLRHLHWQRSRVFGDTRLQEFSREKVE